MASDEYYELKCRECDFTHGIPIKHKDSATDYSVNEKQLKVTCVYGGQFTVTLTLKDFFTISKKPVEGLMVMSATIIDVIKPLHAHLLSHCDPLYLSVKQGPAETHHEYKREPGHDPFVQFGKDKAVVIVGDIDVSKADIPGVSE